MNTYTAQTAIAALKKLSPDVSVSLILITEEDIKKQALKRKLDVSQVFIEEVYMSLFEKIDLDFNKSALLRHIDKELDLALSRVKVLS